MPRPKYHWSFPPEPIEAKLKRRFDWLKGEWQIYIHCGRIMWSHYIRQLNIQYVGRTILIFTLLKSAIMWSMSCSIGLIKLRIQVEQVWNQNVASRLCENHNVTRFNVPLITHLVEEDMAGGDREVDMDRFCLNTEINNFNIALIALYLDHCCSCIVTWKNIYGKNTN